MELKTIKRRIEIIAFITGIWAIIGTFRSEPKDESGTTVLVVEGTYEATRVTAE